jgi:hypothetical protein
MNQVAAAQFGRHVDGEIEISQGRLGCLPVGNRDREVSAHCDEDLDVAPDHGLKGRDDAVAMFARRVEAEAELKSVEKLP